ncbi:MAG: bifunctional glycosyltransferase family 2/GtrA family protein [Micropruina sp.]|nr:bifunctional glycosyltransferase family 2/GtrA family protein [Micropruina sp.]
MIALIPSFEPDGRLPGLVQQIRAASPLLRVVVVDDGSGPGYSHWFEASRELGAEVIGYSSNRGKGSALKFGFAHIAAAHPGQDVVCADSDGQHRVVDILRVAAQVAPGVMVLGVREFDGAVPLRSKLGNLITRQVFRAVSGVAVSDTQTGLRGYPADLLGWLGSIDGDRFEYELNLLLEAKQAGVRIVQLPIATIYLQHNASSHFRPLVDSVRVYRPLLRFGLSSFGAFGIDLVVLLVIQAVTGNLLAAVIAARGLSSAFNFLTNRRFVFDGGAQGAEGMGAQLLRYYGLVLVMLLANYGFLSLLTGWGVGLVVAKVITEASLFLAGYPLQRALVFAPPADQRRAAEIASAVTG